MNTQNIIDIAMSLGWGVRNLNADDTERYSGATHQIYNDFMPDTGQTFWSEEEAWDYIVGRIRGGVAYDARDVDAAVTGHRSTMLKEMMSYCHPTLFNRRVTTGIKGNVYALTQRKQGNAPSFYTMSVGIEILVTIPATGMTTTNYRTFRVDAEGVDPISQEKAMRQLYEQFQAWRSEVVDKS